MARLAKAVRDAGLTSSEPEEPELLPFARPAWDAFMRARRRARSADPLTVSEVEAVCGPLAHDAEHERELVTLVEGLDDTFVEWYETEGKPRKGAPAGTSAPRKPAPPKPAKRPALKRGSRRR